MPDTELKNDTELPHTAGIRRPVNYDSPSELSALLSSLNLGMRKKYGQNFLINPNARKRIAALFDTASGLRAWEIGPGTGAMSYEAVSLGLALSVFEIDPGFSRFMRESYGAVPGFALYEGDFVKTWHKAAETSGRPALAFGNLPYNAAGAIIAALIEGGMRPPRMVFTVQKEAALRICAKPSTKSYSAFSVLCQSLYTPRIMFDLSASSFWPEPRVVSSAVVMTLRSDAPLLAGEKAFTSFTRAAFSSRRKTLRNNLKGAGYEEARIDSAAAAAGIDTGCRAETLTPERLHALYTLLCPV